MEEKVSDGGRKPRVTDDDLLEVLRLADDPVLSTAEIAESVSIQRRSVLNRLRRLENEKKVDSKTIGGRNTVWWLPDDTQYATDKQVDPSSEIYEKHGKELSTEVVPSSFVQENDSMLDPDDIIRRYNEQESPGLPPNVQSNESDTAGTADTDSISIKDQKLEEIGIDPPRDEHIKDAVLYGYLLVGRNRRIGTTELKNKLWKEYGENYSSKDSMWTSINRHLGKSSDIESSYGERVFVAEDMDFDQPPFNELR